MMGISPHFEMEGDEARGLLYGLLEANKIQLRKDPTLPSVRKLIQNGRIIYKRADPNEEWQTYRQLVDQVRDNGVAYGDCEDFATAMAAEDQVRYGVASLPYAYSPRPGLFHVVTAVPEGSFGHLPRHHWPGARGAGRVPGYVLQDPSAAAGMGSFGALPGQEGASMTAFGANGPVVPVRRPRRGLGGILGEFQRGILGGDRVPGLARELGAGIRKGTGIDAKQGGGSWARQLGESIPERFFPGAGSASPPAEPSAVLEPSPSPSDDMAFEEEGDLALDEEFGFFDSDDDLFGLEMEEFEGGVPWQMDQMANRVADDVVRFGASHLGDDEEIYSMGLFRSSLTEPIDDLHEDLGPRVTAQYGRVEKVRFRSAKARRLARRIRGIYRRAGALARKLGHMEREGRSTSRILQMLDRRFGQRLHPEFVGVMDDFLELVASGAISPEEAAAFSAEINERHEGDGIDFDALSGLYTLGPLQFRNTAVALGAPVTPSAPAVTFGDEGLPNEYGLFLNLAIGKKARGRVRARHIDRIVRKLGKLREKEKLDGSRAQRLLKLLQSKVKKSRSKGDKPVRGKPEVKAWMAYARTGDEGELDDALDSTFGALFGAAHEYMGADDGVVSLFDEFGDDDFDDDFGDDDLDDEFGEDELLSDFAA